MQCKYGCNGTGVIIYRGKREPCPDHGHITEETLLGVQNIKNKPIKEYLRIPKQYEKYWIKDVEELFKNEGLVHITEESIMRMKNELEEIRRAIVQDNRIYEKSYYFYSSMVRLERYFYTLQEIFLNNNRTTVPIISVNELCSMIKLQEYPWVFKDNQQTLRHLNQIDREAFQGYKTEMKLDLNYYDYLESELVILRDSEITRKNNLRLLEGFVEERGYNGKVTYVVSSVHSNKDRLGLLSNGGPLENLIKLTPIELESKTVKEKEENKERIDFKEIGKKLEKKGE